MSAPLLSLPKFSVFYGPVQAIHGIALHVGEGEIVTVIGPNGAGKTTLLNAIMGLLPSQGGLSLGGHAVARPSVEIMVRHGVALVPEKRELFGEMSVEDNLLLGGFALWRRGQRDQAARMKEIFGIFPRLEERRAQMASTLSGGERQMLAIGRALMTNPRLLILDEATEGLAPVVRQEIWAGVRRLKADGLSILVVDKSLKELASVADSAVVLERGQSVWHGTLEALTPEMADRWLGV